MIGLNVGATALRIGPRLPEDNRSWYKMRKTWANILIHVGREIDSKLDRLDLGSWLWVVSFIGRLAAM
ncbi:MAG TPA: hypothetical protein DDY14_16695 [Chromatiaceae bacterium]|jgi:hypothetical protein|nr:MAG: hypothetical protein N838_21600 [Thiohalocapsa sp. PB-PSB1]HBG96920.1 hypothetical protein [Chromatiaceae bacterium]HCS89322.1 hypothetical protein [Chromatiaceae bacterium]